MVDLNDATHAPDPNGGWSTAIRTVPDARVVPISKGYLVHEAGVYDNRGHFVHEAVLWRGRPLLVPGPMPEVRANLPGRWVWGGVLIGHFGHFLMESTGRLWALDALQGAVNGIVFVVRKDVSRGEISGFHSDFFDLFCPGLRVHVISEPTRIETLEVPGQGFGIGPLSGGTTIFRDVIHRRFATSIAPRGSDRIYISRSGLGAALGSVLEETRIEQCLADCGYDIFHPQLHKLAEQVARYKAARQVIALDGSALHLVAMLGHADQQVAMIKRRISNGSNAIVRHLAAFTGREPVVVDAISRQWVRSDRRGADHFSFAELDFGRLAGALSASGFVDGPLDWPGLTDAEAHAAVRNVERQLGRKGLTFTPVPRSGLDAVAVATVVPPAAAMQIEDNEAKRARRAARRVRKLAVASRRADPVLR
jgi:hypothetical protein